LFIYLFFTFYLFVVSFIFIFTSLFSCLLFIYLLFIYFIYLFIYYLFIYLFIYLNSVFTTRRYTFRIIPVSTKIVLGQICYKFRKNTYRTQTKVYKILKQISNDVKETARIQGNIEWDTFIQYYRKLWNTTNINELQLEYKSAD